MAYCTHPCGKSVDGLSIWRSTRLYPTPSLTGILTRMGRDGLVLRLKPVNDQRKLYISLTPAGCTLYESAQAQIGRPIA